MSLSTIVQDVEGWAADAEQLLTAAIPGLTAYTDTVAAIDKVATVLSNYQTEANTPAMQNASSAQKLQLFKDHVSKLIASPTPQSESDLEKLQGD